MPEDSDRIELEDFDEISTRLSNLNVLRISLVDEPAVPDSEFNIIKNIFNMEDISLDNEKIMKSLDDVSKHLGTIISQQDEGAVLIKSVVADADESKQLISKNAQAIDDLTGQIASAITAIESLGDNDEESNNEETQELESGKVITDVVEDSEQGLSDKEIEKFATSLKEHYESGLLDINVYGTSLQLLANS